MREALPRSEIEAGLKLLASALSIADRVYIYKLCTTLDLSLISVGLLADACFWYWTNKPYPE